MEPAGGWYREVPVTVDELLALIDEAQVDRAVLVQAVSAYRHDNRYVVDSAQQFTGRCASVVCLDLGRAGSAGELRRLVTQKGAGGLRWWALTDEPLDEPAELGRARRARVSPSS